MGVPGGPVECEPMSDGGDTNGSKDKLPSVPGLRKQLRKTKYCVFHLQGVCHFGDSCAFAHTLEELQGVPDLKKTKLCRFKVCKDGNCPFAHSEKELRSTDTCYKKTLCMWHAKGRCRNGEQCRFAHGTAELRPPKILRHRGGAGPDLQNPSSSSQHSSSSSSSLPQAAYATPPHNAQATLAALAAEPQLQLLLQSLQQQSGANTVEAVQLQGLEQLFAQIQLQQPLVSPACAGALSPQPLQAWLGAMSQQLQQLTEQLQALERTARSHLLETATAVPQRAVPVLPAVAAAQFPSPPVVNNKEMEAALRPLNANVYGLDALEKEALKQACKQGQSQGHGQFQFQ